MRKVRKVFKSFISLRPLRFVFANFAMKKVFFRTPFKILFCAICVLFVKCKEEKKVNRSFYYWKSVFQLADNEKVLLKRLNIEKLYVKFFDVAWSNKNHQAIPVAYIQFKDSIPANIKIIPVIYITNESLVQTPDTELKKLAANIQTLLDHLAAAKEIKFNEIQFDCDWTDGTRVKYFDLLKKIRALEKKEVLLSATIRLHQIKYFSKTGVPPVDRGMLMFYNMGKLKNANTENSIFDVNTASGYVAQIKDYPLKLDAALPIFTWGVHVRNNNVIGLIDNVCNSSMDSIPALRKFKENHYSADTAFFYHGNYFMKDDQVRIEEISPDGSLKAAKLLSSHLKNVNFTVTLFHFDKSNISRYAQQDFENIYSAFY